MTNRSTTAFPPAGPLRRSIRLLSHSAAVGVLLLAAGCSSSARPEQTEAELVAHAAADAEESRVVFERSVGRMLERVERRASETGSAPTIDLLAISGGGDWGAFGAGFLVGWGKVADPAQRRPDFDAVTGVSTGALLAPFAYLSTDEAAQHVETFYRNPQKDWVRDRGMFFFLPSNPSFAEIPGLERDIRATIDQRFIQQMAGEARKGKLLIVSATDLDLGRQKFWELGAEAEGADSPDRVDRVQRMLLSSAAIPAVFPPIQIEDSIYGDGGVTANVFLRLDPRDPKGFIQRWKAAYPGRPFPKVRYWVIVNNQFTHVPKTVQPRWPSVVAPSLETAVRSATIAEIRWLASEANYVNAVFGTDIDVRVVGIPSDWRPPVEGSFQRETMVSLADLGRKLGADPASWQLLASGERARSAAGSAPIVPVPTEPKR